ncbi:hypothetical protein X753_20135 [Mesorhizobium sp. LNJC399B00]|nr:hypothetical protein X753_20135 [Mesorhizobium sp. LNJC399B00]
MMAEPAATKLMATPETIWPPQWVSEAKLCTSANNDVGEPRPPRRRNREAGEQQRPGEHQLLGGDGAGRILHRHHDGARRSEHREQSDSMHSIQSPKGAVDIRQETYGAARALALYN